MRQFSSCTLNRAIGIDMAQIAVIVFLIYYDTYFLALIIPFTIPASLYSMWLRILLSDINIRYVTGPEKTGLIYM